MILVRRALILDTTEVEGGGTGFIRVVRLFLLSFSQGQNFHLNSIRSAQCELSLENINKNPEEKDVMYR